MPSGAARVWTVISPAARKAWRNTLMEAASMTTAYRQDFYAWAQEQAALIRAGKHNPSNGPKPHISPFPAETHSPLNRTGFGATLGVLRSLV